MTRFFMLCGVLAAAGTAHAQAPAPAPAQEPPIATFLEKRVPDELAVEGVMLSRRNLSLKIEPVGDQVVVSLVDLTTGRIAATTKLDTLPPDREAAVAAVTHVVADLSRQIGPQAPVPPGETHDERVKAEVSELRYRRDSIRFGDRYELSAGKFPTLSRYWVAYQGEQDHELDPVSFYKEVGRPDLGKIFAHNIDNRNTALFLGTVATGASLLLLVIGAVSASGDVNANASPNCDVMMTPAQFSACVAAGAAASQHQIDKSSQDFRNAAIPAAILFLGGIVSYSVAFYYAHNAQPIGEDEAMSLADAYNHGLRHNLGLPTAGREPLIRSLKLSPFTATGTDGGLALGGTF
jgi:hypothetical protein